MIANRSSDILRMLIFKSLDPNGLYSMLLALAASTAPPDIIFDGDR